MIWLRGQDLNLRPSGYEPDELPGCSTPRYICVLANKRAALRAARCRLGPKFVLRRFLIAFSRPGSDLLSRVLRRSTIGAGAFHGRVRNGNGCGHPAMTTRSAKGNLHAFGMNIVPLFCFGKPFLLAWSARKGAKARIRDRMSMLRACFEKLVRHGLFCL